MNSTYLELFSSEGIKIVQPSTYEIVCEKEHHVATLSTNTCYNSPCGNLCNEHISVSLILDPWQASDPDLFLSLATIISFILAFQPLS